MNPLSRAGIGTRLSIVLGLSFGLVILVALFGFMQLHGANRTVAEVQESWAPRLEMLRELRLSTDRTGLLVTHQLQTTNFRHLAAIAAELRATELTIDRVSQSYGATLDAPEQRELLHTFLAAWAGWRESHRMILQNLALGDVRQATRTFDTLSRAALGAAEGRLADLAELARRDSNRAARNAAAAYDRALLLAHVAMAAGGLLAGATVVWTRRRIGTPLLHLADDMRRLAMGDLAVVPGRTARGDELGTFATAVAGYRDSLIAGRGLAEEAERERLRLQAAVANMPVGLCMFDAAQRLVVCNRRFAEIYGFDPALAQPGIGLAVLLAGSAAARAGEPAGMATLAGAIECGAPGREIVELPGGQVVSVIHQPLPDGGWVATHEDITERRRVEAQIAYMAQHDALTGLANRLLFREKVEEAVARAERGESFALLCLDLDRFKAVNDTLGHPVGDALLRAVTARLHCHVRKTDIIARLGGDEFAIVQLCQNRVMDAAALARRLVEALSAPYDLNGHQIVIGTSIGIALVPEDGGDADALLKNADLALYRAKADGRGTWRFFEPEMDAQMQLRRALELDLRRALAEQEFELFYQPIIALQTREITGFEALIRWRHPERGLVGPDQFVPLAEEIGLIVPIGEWVLRQACLEAADWPERFKVAVNLSAAQFRGHGPAATVSAALAASGLTPSRLEIEITETVVLKDTEGTLAVLQELKALGVGIAMDDFGTGYSSLSYLRKFPFDRVKIDRSFIQELGQRNSSDATVRAIADLCGSLGLAITAEGIETEVQLNRLGGLQMSGQGYLFGRPCPAAEVPALWTAAALSQAVA